MGNVPDAGPLPVPGKPVAMILRECDGVWKPVVIRPMPGDYSDPAYFWYVRIALWYQKSDGSNTPQGMVKKCLDNPLRAGDGCAG